jgi:hypothetical protein
MLKSVLFILALSISSVFANADDMPAEVQDMIRTMTGEIHGGKARESLKIANPYSTPNMPVENALVETKPKPVKNKPTVEDFKKAKFDLKLKVISCLKEKSPEFLKDTVIKHDACGSLEAKILFDKKLEVYLTQESKFDNLKESKIIRTIPDLIKENDNYVIKDKQIINSIKLGSEVFVIPTTIIGRQVQLDIAVRTTELADIDEVYLDSNDKNFVNNDVALKHRFLVSSFAVDLNKNEILGGNSAILVPMTSDFKSEKNYPETARLWLDVNLSLPK